MQTEAAWLLRHGGPDGFAWGPAALAPPGPGEVRVRQLAIGLNFAEVYQRQGAPGPHQTEQFPAILGSQGAGVIEALGAGVAGWHQGDQVAYIHDRTYARHVNVPVDRMIALAAPLTPELAAAFLVRGLTAEYLLHRLYRVRAGQVILVHAAAGGMGEVLCQWARALGAIVIGTVGSDHKVAVARRHGCHHVINYRRDNFVSAVQAITDGVGVDVVYDAVGHDVFVPSLDCLKPRGIAINYGTASGGVQRFDLQRLHARSLSVCRPTLKTFIADSNEMREAAARFVGALRAGAVHLAVSRRYPLREVAQAHRDLESRETVGAAILVP